MSILPELIIQQVLVRGLRTFREKPELIDMLFRNLTQEELVPLKEFFRNKSIDIAYNYPREGLQLPSIVILLKSEAESQAFLGEIQQGAETIRDMGGTIFLEDQLLGAQTVLGSGSREQVTNRRHLLLNPTAALGGNENQIWADLSVSRLIDPFEEESSVVLMEGTGAGQRRTILSIVPSAAHNRLEIEVDQNWSTNPDDTTIFKIEGTSFVSGLTGEPSHVIPLSDNVERLGQIYRAGYQLDINGPNQEAAIYLYNIVKAIMIISRRILIGQGFLRGITMSGSDLAPVMDYFPSEAFRRSLILDFEYSFDVFIEIEEAVASQFELSLSAREPNTSNPEVVASTTTF